MRMRTFGGLLALMCLFLVPALLAAPVSGVTAAPHDRGSSPSPPPTAPARPAPAEPTATAPTTATATVALTGDVLIHDSVWAAAQRATAGQTMDFRPMLAPLRPTLSAADLALCHLETPLAPRGGPYRSYPLFAAPPAVVPALRWAGYDGCSTASNHSVDQGFDGVVRTLDRLDEQGLAHTGTARTADEANRIVTFDVNGIRIAWLSATFGTNGLPVDSDRPWSVRLIDVAEILADARRARETGADAVIVALHWGDEYVHTPSDFQIEVARRLTRSKDITLLYGHHAHVVQPIRKVNGTWVIYGLGNLLAGQRDTAPGVHDGLIAQVTLSRTGSGPVRVLRPTYRPTYIDEYAANGKVTVYDVRRALADPTLPETTRAALRASWARTRTVLADHGAG